MKKRQLTNVFTTILLLAAAAVTLFPILWTFVTSLKTDVQMFSIPPKIFPFPVTGKHYLEIIWKSNFLRYLRNSILVAGASCLVSMAAGIPAAYGFAKFSSKKTKPIFAAATAVRMVPQVAMVIPYFMIIRNLKLSDTIAGLVLTYIPFELTLVIWILKNFFHRFQQKLKKRQNWTDLELLADW